MAFKYSYESSLKKGERQYDKYYDLKNEKKVMAKYVQTYQYKGNYFIEALPKGRCVEEVLDYYNRNIKVPDIEDLEKMDEFERCDTVEVLDDFRVALPFHAMLELEFHRSLIRSYKKRIVLEDANAKLEYIMGNQKLIGHNCTVSKDYSDPALGFTLLGTSGCGKSTGINMMLENYPQVIIHQPDTWQRITQIVYLHIHCPQNSNFHLLYKTIGRAFDRALGNIKPVYEVIIDRPRDLGGKYAVFRELVEKFAVGMIILDEIELMDTRSTKESSFEMFMQLANETGVAVSVVGTMDAYTDIFSKRRTARRTGVLIHASKYCTKMNQFRRIVDNLSMFQWRCDPIYYDETLVKALYEVTDGVIADLVEVYKQIQKECLRNKKKKISPEYIRTIANKYYEGLRNVSLLERNPLRRDKVLTENEIKRLNSFKEGQEQRDIEKRYDELMDNPIYKTYNLLEENVIRRIQALSSDYTRAQIEAAFTIIMKKEKTFDIHLEDAVTKTLVKLQSKTEKVKADIDKAREELLANNESEKISGHTIQEK